MSFADKRNGFHRGNEMSSLGKNAEIQDIIQNLAKRNMKLERMCAKLGTRAEASDDPAKIHQDRAECVNLIKQAHGAMKENTTGDREIMEKLKKQLDAEVKKFHDICHQMEEKEKIMKAALLQQEGAHVDETTPLTYGQSTSSDRSVPQQQKQQSIEVDTDFLRYHDQDVAQRHSKLLQIERDTQEILDVYKDLKSIVEVQQENIDVIDNNIQDVKLKTDAGLSQLIDAENSQKKARKRKCCMVFLVLGLLCVVVALLLFFNKK